LKLQKLIHLDVSSKFNIIYQTDEMIQTLEVLPNLKILNLRKWNYQKLTGAFLNSILNGIYYWPKLKKVLMNFHHLESNKSN
jgi:hypothetical protein